MPRQHSKPLWLVEAVPACSAVTSHLLVWQNYKDFFFFLVATAATGGWNRCRYQSQQRKLILEKKILLLLMSRTEPTIFWSQVWRFAAELCNLPTPSHPNPPPPHTHTHTHTHRWNRSQSYQAKCVSSRNHVSFAAVTSCDASWQPPSLAPRPLSPEIWFAWNETILWLSVQLSKLTSSKSTASVTGLTFRALPGYCIKDRVAV